MGRTLTLAGEAELTVGALPILGSLQDHTYTVFRVTMSGTLFSWQTNIQVRLCSWQLR